MKKVFSKLATAAAIILLAAGCGGNSPSGIAGSILKAGKAGAHEQMIAIAAKHLDSQTLAMTKAAKGLLGGLLGAETVDGLVKKGLSYGLKAVVNGNKKIADYSIVEEQLSDGGRQDVVVFKVIFDDGSESTDSMNFVKENGKWKIKFINL